MKSKQIIGLIIFGLGVAYMILVGALIGKIGISPALHLSSEEFKESPWMFSNLIFVFWMLSGFLGPIIAVVGILLYVNTKGAYIWIAGVGMLLIYAIIQFIIPYGYYQPVYGIGGHFNSTVLLGDCVVLGKKISNS